MGSPPSLLAILATLNLFDNPVITPAVKLKSHFLLLSYITVNGELVSSIGKGLCVLLGISRNDTHKETEWMLVYLH